jgi:23S rRNA pseudouridine1911/1915/1917 synthase
MTGREPAAGLGFTATDADAGRIDAALARRFPGAGRRHLAELFARGAVRVDGKRAKKGDRVAAGARVELAEDPAQDRRAVADPDAAARLAILWRGADAIAVAKPAGMPSQPLRAGERGCAANGIVHLVPAAATASDDPRDGGLVHRLDIGTSGVLVAATTPAAWRRLRAAFSAGRVTKRYLALATALPRVRRCDAALSQRGDHVVVDEADGLAASTEFEPLAAAGGYHLIACTTRTGRMHQVRAHLAHAGAPIAGDTRYGGAPVDGLDGFFLHAWRTTIEGELDVTAPLPAERAALLARLGLQHAGITSAESPATDRDQT